jgi:hypothetical protein
MEYQISMIYVTGLNGYFRCCSMDCRSLSVMSDVELLVVLSSLMTTDDLLGWSIADC